ncbi:Nuclear protein X1 isoform 2 [Hibiscus syriacus]|uniref:Nuclear protein X1 isoform 2 n=1 Tax=Hibiscus syriacus TaxID=106335 RepID=A0A6A3AKP9_HIBSY|nr:Nuclear protein X1 isoform 2 [Hibiscus syriacus]
MTSGYYSNPMDFAADVRLTFSNAMTYNPPGNDVNFMAKAQKLLDDYLHKKQKNQAKAESCEMELLNESGFSNSSLQPCKGNDLVVEVIDIVGSGYPLVEIEKGSTHRNSRCSSSSRFSGESGSSYSGLYNCTEHLNSETNVESKKSSVFPDDGNQSLNEFCQVELNSHDKSSAFDEEGHQEEESAASERQVSPEKLYRATLLKNRFAYTILKAREKALEKGEKGDPEKLRMEREELERRQREEKTRLQAEAKAAEETRQKAEAEAEAVAEAKRRREIEREAARQALLQMEKTVDINESSQFIQDLEMHFVDGANCRSIPLEQLGLYMEEEEEEDEPPQTALEAANDVEEEISGKAVIPSNN